MSLEVLPPLSVGKCCAGGVCTAKRLRILPKQLSRPAQERGPFPLQVQVSWQQTSGAGSGVNGVLRVVDLREAAPQPQLYNSKPAVFVPGEEGGSCCILRLMRPPRLAGIALLSNARLIEVYKRVGSRPADEYMGTGARLPRPIACITGQCARCCTYIGHHAWDQNLPIDHAWTSFPCVSLEYIRSLFQASLGAVLQSRGQVANEWNDAAGVRRYTTELSLPVRPVLRTLGRQNQGHLLSTYLIGTEHSSLSSPAQRCQCTQRDMAAGAARSVSCTWFASNLA